MYVNSDRAGEKETRRSKTRFLVYTNKALVRWLSKKQPTIETSVFRAKFVAMKNRIETLQGLGISLGWRVYNYLVRRLSMEITCQ